MTTTPDHVTESPATWVAATSDVGHHHDHNEDAFTLDADPTPGSRALLVVCDGVSSAPGSDRAAVLAARVTREMLLASVAADPAMRTAALAEQPLATAIAAANDAVTELATDPDRGPACTLAAATVDQGVITWANVGDSRVYWLAEDAPQLLSVDDSLAQTRIAMGVDRQLAEQSPGAHAITRWLGISAPDELPHVGQVRASAAGWVLVCTDGLWNYASDPIMMQRLLGAVVADGAGDDPVAICEQLVTWALAQGGHDNVTVAVARIDQH